MDTNENPVQDAPVTASNAAKKAVRKPRKTAQSAVHFALPLPTRADGTPDATLITTMHDKFQNAILVRSGNAKVETGVAILNPNSSLGHLSRFVAALLNSYTSGFGLSAEGSAAYVAKHVGTVKTAFPTLLGTYDVYFSLNQSGALAYRISLADMTSQVLAYAKASSNAIAKYGSRKPGTREKALANTPAVVLPK